MGESSIEWTEQTWNPIVGCSVVSPGCTNCYAMKMAARLERMGQDRYRGLTRPSKAGAVWTGEMRLVEEALTLPLRRRKPTTWFVNSMSDLFHESVPDEWIDQVFAVMALKSKHTFQVLTKRADRMRAYLSNFDTPGRIRGWIESHEAHSGPVAYFPHLGRDGRWPLANVWVGVSAEDQRRADERVPDLLATPAAVRFVSAEPLLGPINFTSISTMRFRGAEVLNSLTGELQGMFGDPCGRRLPHLDWIIVGGESGPGARPIHPDWARQIRDACAAAGVAFHFKQWGEWLPGQNERASWDDEGQASAHWQDGKWGPFTPASPAKNYVMWSPDGIAHPGGSRTAENCFPVAAWAARVGKKAAGRLLDGVEHNGMPTTA